MPDKVQAWRSSDGKLFELEDEAKAHEFELAFRAWARSGLDAGEKDFTDPQMIGFINRIIEDRMKLLPIFKGLNGGNGLSVPAPPRETPNP